MNMEFTPFYMNYPEPVYNYAGLEQDWDMERLKNLYPNVAKEVQTVVEDECDKLEYDGSVMFDEYPDQLMFRRICGNIYNRVKHLEDGVQAVEVQEEDAETVTSMNYRRPPQNNWLEDLITIMLVNEMHRRRCRYRNCRGWYW